MHQRPVVISLEALYAQAAHRPDGYVADIMSHGKVVGTNVELSPEAHREMVAKYRRTAAKWPEWALVLKALAADGERGVGDTAERLFGLFDTPQFKAWHQNVFGCACASRCPKEWNARYPYIDLPR